MQTRPVSPRASFCFFSPSVHLECVLAWFMTWIIHLFPVLVTIYTGSVMWRDCSLFHRTFVSWPVTMLCSSLMVSACFLFCSSAAVSRPPAAFGPMPVWVFTCCGLSCSYFPRAVSVYVFLLYNCCVYSGRVTLLFGYFLTTAFKELNGSCMVDPCDTRRPVDFCSQSLNSYFTEAVTLLSVCTCRCLHVLRCFSNEACDLPFTHGTQSDMTVLRWGSDKLDISSRSKIDWTFPSLT